MAVIVKFADGPGERRKRHDLKGRRCDVVELGLLIKENA